MSRPAYGVLSLVRVQRLLFKVLEGLGLPDISAMAVDNTAEVVRHHHFCLQHLLL
jgi:hypothetical protein